MKKELGIRERLALRLIIFALKVLQPYEYSHQFDESYKALEKELTN